MSHEDEIRYSASHQEMSPAEQVTTLADELRAHDWSAPHRSSILSFADSFQGHGARAINDPEVVFELPVPGGIGESFMIRNILTGGMARDARIGVGPTQGTVHIFHPIKGIPQLTFRTFSAVSFFQPNRPEPTYAVVSSNLVPEKLWTLGA